MKKIMLVLLAMVILSGCAPYTLTKVEGDYGRPARVEIECIAGAVCDENTYYNNKSAIEYIFWFYYWERNIPWTQKTREWCWEVKADKNGKVINYREYIEQQSKVKSGRPAIQIRGGKLPGVE
ncbi:MAG: hypothetical protein H6Q41_1236 [Deltaproteobacteria bacterium]|jgi:hypothetical protein|nr:hypothetical protein [Deltaproteobacteria bacterium]